MVTGIIHAQDYEGTANALPGVKIKWGLPVNGLRIGVYDSITSVTADQSLTFKITVQNVSRLPISLPTPDTFVLASNPRSNDYHTSPILPVIEMTRIAPPYDQHEGGWSMGDTGVPADKSPEKVQEIAPGQSATWESVPLEKHYYYGDRLPPGKKTTVQKWFLLPGYQFHIRFRLANEMKIVEGKNVWTGEADSPVTDVTVKAPSIDGIKLEGSFTLPKQNYFLGEPIETTFTVTNKGESSLSFPTGGDYRGTGRHDRYTIHAADEHGHAVPDPVPPSGMGGGLGSSATVDTDKTYSEKLLVNQWCAFQKPGKYRITCKRTINVIRSEKPAPKSYSWPESSLPTIPIESTLEVIIENNQAAQTAYIAGLGAALLDKGRSTNEAREQLRSMAQTHTPAAFPEIVRLLDGPPNIQAEAVQWLTYYGSEKSSPILIEHMSKLSPSARQVKYHR